MLIVSTIALSWLGMMAVHDLGHCLGAWATDGSVARVVLDPRTISRTELASNPRPLFTVWAGPLVGVLLPLLAWSIAATLRWSGAFWLRFFAGFCLIANGAYIGGGSFERAGDAGDMLRHGSQSWHLWIFGLVCAAAGLALWHRLGPHFGLGAARVRVSRAASYSCAAVLVVVTVVELWLA